MTQPEFQLLAEFHADIGRVWRGIGDRIALLDRLIESEKAARLLPQGDHFLTEN